MICINHLCDASVHVGFDYLLNSIQSVPYTIEKGVAVVNMASEYCVGHRYGGISVKMFANVPKLAYVVVATLDDRVDVRDKVEI